MQTLMLEPILGPVCDMQDAVEDSGGCYHDSCQWIDCNGRIKLAEGPVCGELEYQGICDHESCAMIEPNQMWCDKHGWQIVSNGGSGGGFAGGRIYWTELACGCVDMDESDDIRAAY
ncbi:MAG TPA: hypothetical protein VNS88_14060 [Nitrospiraceae bacterium]|nr:hypothetical protein [Nitrospiraceae bacterium]